MRTRLMRTKLERLKSMKVASPPHFVPLNILLCFRSFVLKKCLMTLADNAASAAAAAAALTVRRGADGAKVRNDGDELAAADSGLEALCSVQM